jgi:hypothetical protein
MAPIARELLRDGGVRYRVVEHPHIPMSGAQDIAQPRTRTRGAPLVATLARGGVALLVVLGVYFSVSRFVFEKLHVATQGPGMTLANLMDASLLLSLAFVWFAHRAEESRLGRELRTARTGSPDLRALALRQRQQTPLLARFCAAHLGTAAVLLADGDVDGAHHELRTNPWLARGGRLDRLREVVEADELRAGGTTAGLARCIDRLRELPATGNREADLYKTHVLVKAILQKGDSERAQELCAELDKSADEDLRLYAVWLVVWFESEEDPGATYRESSAPGEPSFAEGDLRMAALLARAQGAEELVVRLEERVERLGRSAGPIADAQPRE